MTSVIETSFQASSSRRLMVQNKCVMANKSRVTCLFQSSSWIRGRRHWHHGPPSPPCLHVCLLHVEHILQQVFLIIVWHHLSIVSVLFLNVCFLSSRTTRPKYCSFLLLTSARTRHVGFSSSNIESLVPSNWFASSFILSVHVHLKCV